ncbi:MAG: homoserine dehydrogenase, partial [Planctomycetaceae bacterium]
MSSAPLSVALIGLGNVGSGVAKILVDEAERVTRRAGRPILLRRAVVRNLEKQREVQLAEGILCDDVQQVIDDPEIDVAIQLIGGIQPAREIMLALLESGKHVVTANKALLCEHSAELFGRARELGRSIAFEAAVAGGIPIISALSQSMTANQIVSIEAILNGTSNYILTEMLERKASYEDVL